MLIMIVADRFTAGWSQHKVITAVLFVLLGFGLTDVSASGTIPFWLLGSLIKGLLLWVSYLLVLRYRVSLAPWIYVPFLLVQGAKGFSQAAFPGAQAGCALGMVMVVIVAFVWERWLRAN